MTESLIRLRNLTKTYGDTGGGVRNIDLEVQAGDFIAIMGTSGAGKSTLLNVLGLLDTFDSGEYEFLGERVESFTRSRADDLRAATISFVFQASHVMPFETIERNAALGMAQWRIPRTVVEDRIARVLHAVGLEHRIGALGRELSGGERQRLAVARAIATTPRLLLADEPTGNLDEANTAALMQLFSSLNRQGVTIIVITHDREVASYAKRLLTLRDGRFEKSELRTLNSPKREMARLASLDLPQPESGAKRKRIGPLLDAINAITARFSRTLGLAGSLGLAVAGLVAAVGIGATASEQVADRLTESALDEVHVNLPADISYDLASDQEAIIARLSRVEGVGLRSNLEPSDAAVTRYPLLGGVAFSGSTVAVSAEWFRLVEASVEPAGAASLFDSVSNIAIVGRDALDELGYSGWGAGQQIFVAGRPYDIVGTVADSGRLEYLSDAVIIPASSAPMTQSEILVRVTQGFPAAVADAVPYALNPASPGSISVSTVADLRNLRRGVQSDLTSLIAVIGATLLLVAVLSAATSMYLSIQGRIQEIALRRALGSSRRDIAAMFMMEGVLLGVAGSCLGLALGLLGVVATSALQTWTPAFPAETALLAFACGIGAGGLSAVVPALRAAQIQPAEAIRA